MKRSDLHLLLEKVTCRFKSWTVKHSSYAGRLELIKSVIYYVIILWAFIFVLPNECIKALVLWKDTPYSSRGAKILWESVFPLKSVGSWIETVTGMKQGFRYKTCLVDLCRRWLIVSLLGSCKPDWNKKKIGILTVSHNGSWIWKDICKLLDIARPYIVCEVASCNTVSFWHDTSILWGHFCRSWMRLSLESPVFLYAPLSLKPLVTAWERWC